MAHLFKFSLGLNINPPLTPGTTVGLQNSPIPLLQVGFNMLVELSIASVFLKSINPPTLNKTITVMAHFDTGASRTSIEHSIASHLGLIATGQQQIGTANGFAQSNNYALDIAFLNTPFSGVQNLQVSSCTLPHFNLKNCLRNPNQETNFGILIGRDLMSRWHITWHGPTSTVLVSD